jgi:phosphatidylglycerol:prolipoprotein diacylglycerol transferase
MRPIIVSRLHHLGIPEWLIPDYWFMFTLAIIVSSLMALHLWRRSGHRGRTTSELLFWGIPGLFVGTRLFHFLQFGFPQTVTDFWSEGGFALYGGLAGLLTVWILYYLVCPYPFLTFLDCVTPSLALGLFLGRIGCFLAGCDGGTACALPWSVRFPPDTSPYTQQLRDGFIEHGAEFSLAAHPTQLYESLFGLVTFFFLLHLFKRRRWEGEVFFSGMLWYAVFRFATEPLRADSGGLHPLGIFTFSQFVSVVVFLGVIVGLIYIRRQPSRWAKHGSE